MIGQTKLLRKLNSYSMSSFPHTILLLGENGSGKHEIVNFISQKLNLPSLNITDKISSEFINSLYLEVNPKLYLVDISLVDEKEQNMLLKLLEEPTNLIYLILVAENTVNILDTVVNRCLIMEMDSFTKEELSPLLNNIQVEDKDFIINTLRTPGQILKHYDKIKDIKAIGIKLIEKLGDASLPNTLTIANKINLKDEFDKFDLVVFLDIIINLLFTYYKKTNNNLYLKAYNLTIEEKKKLRDRRLNKQSFIEYYLVRMWELYRGIANY